MGEMLAGDALVGMARGLRRSVRAELRPSRASFRKCPEDVKAAGSTIDLRQACVMRRI
jgi:hypothetical protein